MPIRNMEAVQKAQEAALISRPEGAAVFRILSDHDYDAMDVAVVTYLFANAPCTERIVAARFQHSDVPIQHSLIKLAKRGIVAYNWDRVMHSDRPCDDE